MGINFFTAITYAVVAVKCSRPRGARRNFFRGGQAMYLLSTGVNKTLLLQPGFAKGLEPKVEMILFKKCCNWTAC